MLPQKRRNLLRMRLLQCQQRFELTTLATYILLSIDKGYFGQQLFVLNALDGQSLLVACNLLLGTLQNMLQSVTLFFGMLQLSFQVCVLLLQLFSLIVGLLHVAQQFLGKQFKLGVQGLSL